MPTPEEIAKLEKYTPKLKKGEFLVMIGWVNLDGSKEHPIPLICAKSTDGGRVTMRCDALDVVVMAATDEDAHARLKDKVTAEFEQAESEGDFEKFADRLNIYYLEQQGYTVTGKRQLH